VIDLPTFASKEGVKPTIAVSDPHPGQVTQTHSQGRLITGTALVGEAGIADLNELTASADAELESRNKGVCQPAFLLRLQSFFASTS
jgi:hypothetical protein